MFPRDGEKPRVTSRTYPIQSPQPATLAPFSPWRRYRGLIAVCISSCTCQCLLRCPPPYRRRLYHQHTSAYGSSADDRARNLSPVLLVLRVVTQATSIELCHLLRSRTLMYVDDIIGVGMAGVIEEDIHHYD